MNSIEDRVLDLAAQIQAIPAPTFHEGERAEFVRNLFLAEQLQDVGSDSIHNVYARLPGRSAAHPLIVSAHLDTVFGEDTPHRASRQPGRIRGPGIGDNSLGVAALFGLLWLLRSSQSTQPGDVWLVANVREEGLGDLQGMKRVVSRFADQVRGYLIIEGSALGQVYHRAVGVRRYRVGISTMGGHSWSDYGQPSAVHELARLITRLTSLQLPDQPRTTLNVGTIAGGEGINVLASHAGFDLDVRCESETGLKEIASRVEAVVDEAGSEGVSVKLEVIGQRPAGEISAGHPLVQLAGACITEQGFTPAFTTGSTDANIPLSMGLPAVVLGVTTGAGAHTPHEYIDTPPVAKGLQQLLRFVVGAMRLEPAPAQSAHPE